jgi:hypothetical protein
METNARAGHDTITLQGGQYKLTISGVDDTAAQGDLDITDSLGITGVGSTFTVIDASPLTTRDRVFDVRQNGTLILTSLRVTGGLPRSAFAGGEGGGARVMDGASLSLNRVLVDGNQAVSIGGGIAGHTGSSISLVESTIDRNQAGGDAGGISIKDGQFTMDNSTVSRNVAARDGGGILYTTGRYLLIRNSTISSNTPGGRGGGLFISMRQVATALIYQVEYATIAYNAINPIVSGSGANIFYEAAPNAPEWTIWGSIVTNGSRGGICGGKPPKSLGFNIQDANLCGFNAPGDILGNPAIGPLRVDNSLTEVHPLQRSSLAVDAIRDCRGGTDQRSVSRPKDGNGDGTMGCDIGAYEFDNR